MVHGKRGLLVRLLYLFAAVLYFFVNKVTRRNHGNVIVLAYHGVKKKQKKKFAQQMRMVDSHTVSGRCICQTEGNKNQSFLICVTFDDAFTNLLTNAIPVITELKIPITVFISTGSLGSFPSWLQGSRHPDSTEMVLSVEELLELKKNPLITFGSHTVSHPRLSQKPVEEMREELHVSRETLNEIIGENISNLALPHGDYSTDVVRVAIKEGYKRIYTLDPIVYSCESNSAPNLIGRFAISPDAWAIEFFLVINGAYAWLYAWRSFVKKIASLIHR